MKFRLSSSQKAGPAFVTAVLTAAASLSSSLSIYLSLSLTLCLGQSLAPFSGLGIMAVLLTLRLPSVGFSSDCLPYSGHCCACCCYFFFCCRIRESCGVSSVSAGSAPPLSSSLSFVFLPLPPLISLLSFFVFLSLSLCHSVSHSLSLARSCSLYDPFSLCRSLA
jgi:hypothetical protein